MKKNENLILNLLITPFFRCLLCYIIACIVIRIVLYYLQISRCKPCISILCARHKHTFPCKSAALLCHEADRYFIDCYVK